MGSPRMDNAACPIDPGGRHIVVGDHAPSSESETRLPPGRSHGTSSMSHRPAQEAIQLPESDEDWDMFISRYAQGALHSSIFPTTIPEENESPRQSSSSSGPGRPSSTHQARINKDVDPQLDTGIPPTPSSASPQLGSQDNDSAQLLPSETPHPSTPPTHTPSPAGSGNEQGDSSSSEQITPAPQGSFQDPNIPDIPPSDTYGDEAPGVERRDFVYESEGQKVDQATTGEAKQTAKGRSQREVPQRTVYHRAEPSSSSMFRARREGDAVQEEGLTRENMRQLDIQAGQGSRSGVRKRRDQVALATPHDMESHSSEGGSPGDAARTEGDPARNSKRRPGGHPRSRGSLRSISRAGSTINNKGGELPRERGGYQPEGSILLDSGTGSTTNSGSHIELDFDIEAERTRIRNWFNEKGYLPPPRQPPEGLRRRLRVIRRLGFDSPSWNSSHSEEIQIRVKRFTRLARSFFKCTGSVIQIVGLTKASIMAAENFPVFETENESAICSHTVVAAPRDVLVVPDMSKDWRFRHNPYVKEGTGPVVFYAGAPLVIGKGPKAAVIGTLCVMDDKPRSFSKADKAFLKDMAAGVVSELELLYTQTASIESAKLHQISVDFLRRSLKSRPLERAGRARTASKNSQGTGSSLVEGSGGGKTKNDSSSNKRKEGADQNVLEHDIDIYDEACLEIRRALDAYAVAVVDLSQFHLFYPAFGGSSTGGTSTRSSRTRRMPASFASASRMDSNTVRASSARPAESAMEASLGPDDDDDELEGYSRIRGSKRAQQTYALRDPTAPSQTPQVLYIPSGRRTGSKNGSADESEDLAMLGYSCEHDNFAFNFTSSPAAKKIISDFIAANVKTRQVWYTRDDSEGIAKSINHLMPPGTETSMAMPIFGFDGQVAFAVVACWTDPLYTYPAGAMQFVETIAGSLLASVMKERLHQAERAQLNFAAAASHELRTPLHQINAAASLLRALLQNGFLSPASSPSLAEKPPPVTKSQTESPRNHEQAGQSPVTAVPIVQESNTQQITKSPEADRPPLQRLPSEDRVDAMNQLEIIETNGLALGTILENIIDTLDIGRLTSKLETKLINPEQVNAPGAGVSTQLPGGLVAVTTIKPVPTPFDELLEKVVLDAISLEERSRRARGVKVSYDVEVVLEVLPRNRGSWQMAQDPGPLVRAIGKIVHNACKFTDKGYVQVTVQDVSRDVVLPAGYDNSIRTSIISIDIKDSGKGMSADFLEDQVLQPFTGTDSFTPGSGLGLRLAQRMVELLGGKLAIASTPGKGTLVHVEVPLQLFNEDNESDQDELYERKQGEQPTSDRGSGSVDPDTEDRAGKIRQDGIYLVGFDSDSALKRVGKSVLRQLKMNFCRVVPDIQYAGLIVAPRTTHQQALIRLASQARRGVEIILIDERTRSMDRDHRLPSPVNSSLSPESSMEAVSSEDWDGISVRHVSRPIRPSVMAEIMRPVRVPPEDPEQYISPVVGGGPDIENRAAPSSSPRITRPSVIRHDTLLTEQTDPSSDITTPLTAITDQGNLASPTGSPVLGDMRELPTLLPVDKEVEALTTDLKGIAIDPVQPHFADLQEFPSEPRSLSVSQDDSASSVASDRIDIDESIDGSKGASSRGAPSIADITGQQSTPSTSSYTNSKTVLRVLVVEDNDVNRQIITTMLKRTKCEYAEARDGEEAVEQYVLHRPHLILLDINMPKKDGFQAATEIRTIERGANSVGHAGHGHRRPKLSTTGSSRAQRSLSALPTSPADTSRSTEAHHTITGSPIASSQSLGSQSQPHSPVTLASLTQMGVRMSQGEKMRTRIVAVTAMSSEAHRRKGMIECGIDVWLSKPVGIKAMRDVIQRAKVEMLGEDVEG